MEVLPIRDILELLNSAIYIITNVPYNFSFFDDDDKNIKLIRFPVFAQHKPLVLHTVMFIAPHV